MNAELVVLSGLRGLTVVLGAWIVVLSFRAYRASHRRSLAWLTAAVALITVGAIAEGLAFNLGWSLEDARILDASVNVLAMSVFAVALHVRENIIQRRNGQTAYPAEAATSAR